ncbi:MAG: electron transfer flavoprotein subunit alpha/FixB family protein [Oscillospiraceae bacterium]
MSKQIWVFAEQVQGKLDPIVFELLTKARDLAPQLGEDTQIGAVLLGSGVDGLAQELADFGADVVYVADDEALAMYNPMLYTPVIADLCKKEGPEIFLFGATAIGAELGPTVAVPLATGVAAHCVDMRIGADGIMVADVPSFGGKILGEILCPYTKPQMASVKSGIFVCGTPEAKPLNVKQVDLSALPKSVPLKPVKLEKRAVEGVPLDKADIVLCGGFGLTCQNSWDQMTTLAAKMNGAAGATRPAIDEGWAPGEHVMIGTSGKSIRPKVYIGFGISGATHHVCGMKDSGYVISVNRDENVPMFEVSDAFAVADPCAVIDALVEKLG